MLQLPAISDIERKHQSFQLRTALLFAHVLAFLTLPFFLIIRYVFNVKFIRLRSDRIGHLSANTEEFLREVRAGQRKKLHYIAIVPATVANSSLVQLWKRYITIIQFRQPSIIRVIIKFLAARSLLCMTDCFEAIPFKEDNPLWNSAAPIISFTPQEEKEGKELLKKMNVDDWFVCFHARDSSYLGKHWSKGDWQHSHRNCSIENFIEAAMYACAQGGYALRMGSVVEKKLPPVNSRVIDYATTHRTEFGDIYLMAKCKFFIGNTAGIVCVSYIFNVPNITTNLQLLTIPPVGKHDLFIPKKLWYEREKRFLTFKEMIESSVLQYMSAKDLEDHGLRFIENTSHEILAVTQEMNERIDGTWKTTEEDEQLQKRFKALYVKGKHCFGPPPGRIGAQFLRENKEMLA